MKLQCVVVCCFMLLLPSIFTMITMAASRTQLLDCLLQFQTSVTDPAHFLHTWNLSLTHHDLYNVSLHDPNHTFFPGVFYVCDGVDCYILNLSLPAAGFSGDFPLNLSACQYLRYMDLSRNHFTGSLPTNFSDQLPFLISLNLSANNLSSSPLLHPAHQAAAYESTLLSLTRYLDFMNYISEIDLSLNGLSGEIPPQLLAFTALTHLDLSNNRITGFIPDTLESLNSIQYFDCSHNNLTGSIPAELHALSSLTHFDVSHNQLIAAIPASLDDLSSLRYLDVSNNNLSGSIPIGLAKFFDSDSFQGNARLCGPPLPRECEKRRPIHTYIAVSVAIGVLALLLLVVSIVLYRRQKEKLTGERDYPELVHFDRQLRLTEPQLQAATSHFSEDNLIGVGGFSAVYKGLIPGGEIVAVKLLLGKEQTKIRRNFLTELKILGQVRHRNLLRIRGYCLHAETMALILDFMPRGSLEKLLHSDCHVDWSQRLHIATDVARGLAYLHHDQNAQPIVHRDLKPSNILLDSNLNARISDFGIAKVLSVQNKESTASSVFTVGYAAPEFVQSAKLSTAMDVYSFGVVLLELLTRERPTSSRFGEGLTISNWVEQAIENGAIEDLLDKNLRSSSSQHHHEAILCVMKMALACTCEVPSMRPEMRDVVGYLERLEEGKLSEKFYKRIDSLLNHEATPIMDLESD